jgi:HYR domain/GEVED domain
MNVFLPINRNLYTLNLFIASAFVFSTAYAQSQPCATPNIGATSVGEPFNIAIGQGKNDVYFGTTVPTYRDILGVNFAIYQLENNKIAAYVGTDISGQPKTALDAFSSIRIFYPIHRDYWNLGDERLPPFAANVQVPINNLANLRLVIDNAGVPLLGGGYSGKVVYPVVSTTVAGKVDLVTEPLSAVGAYFNVYQNYMNNNWIKLRGSFDYLRNSSAPISKKYSVALEVFPANFQQKTSYDFPNNWFLANDWGLTDAERKLNAKAYAMMFARAYSPKTSDCATCPSLVETIEIGNEPWGYTNPATYHNVVQGFIEGLADYYGTDTLNKIRLLPASFQAHHAENTATANVSDINSWKDYINTRLPASSKCVLEGVNLHLYSNTIQGSSLTLNSSYPEKVAQSGTQTTALSHFFYIRNAWKWLKDNNFTKKNLYVTEFGWDSDGCTTDRAVGMKTQAIYTIRNLLMMGRYGVKKANLYQIEDDPNAGCGFAYFSSGVFNTKRAPKYIFKALENFVQKTGATKFHYALREDANDVHAYILEQQDKPKYMVAWLARNINYADDTKTLSQVIALGGADLSDGVGALKNIELTFNGKNYTPDATLPWYRLDGETTAPLSKTTYFVGGQYKLSPVPILIPIVESCNPDSQAPVFANCPANIAQTTTGTTAIVAWAPPTVADNCTATPTTTSTHTSGAAFPIGATTVVYTARDASNNAATCSFTITVTNPCANDTTKPVFANCPTSIAQRTTGTTAIANWTPPTATDNCGTPSVSSTHNAGATFPIGATSVTYTARDAKNNAATCTFNITVSNPCANDTIAPVFDNCPTDIAQTTATTADSVWWTPPTVTDNCTTPQTMTASHTSGTLFPVGTTTVTYTARDAKNNVATCTFKVNMSNPCLIDTLAPVFSTCPGNITKTTTDTAAVAAWVPPSAFDNCDESPTITGTHASGSVFKLGSTTVTFTARDNKNNKSTCVFAVTVVNPCANDTIKPILSACPAPVSQTTSGTTATATWTPPTATDNCSVPTLSSTQNSGAAFPIGTTSVTYTATDAKNNKSTCTFTVTVAPEAANYCASKSTEPWQEWVAGVQLNTINNLVQANEGKARDFNAVGYSDFTEMQTTLVVGQNYPLSIKAGFSWLGILDNLYCRTWIDFNGNNTFEDTEKVFEGKSKALFTANILTPSNIVGVKGLPRRMRVSMKSGGYPTACETFGRGEVEDYTVNIQTDTTACGNDRTAPIFTTVCPANIVQSTSTPTALVTWVPPTATDNCSVPTITSSHLPNTAFPVGITNVTYTATDASNNAKTCTFSVTITSTNLCATDTTAPVFSNCPANIAKTTSDTAAIATWTPPTATDNCSSTPSVLSTKNSGATFKIGTTTVTYTATDAQNNKATCAFTVTVSPQNANYCGSKSAEPYQEWISGVRFGTINNAPQANEGKTINWSVVGYSDFTNLISSVNRGQNYPLSITPSLSWAGRLTDLYCRVWVDFNGDKTFDDTEKVLERRGQNPFISTVAIPIAAISGNTRMRVSLKWGSLPTACENFTSGEVEDYTVNIGGSDCTNDTAPPVFANCPVNIARTTPDTTAIATWTPPTATDNCTLAPSVSSTHNAGGTFKIGTTTVIYTSIDAKNNKATCTFTVTVTNPCTNDTVPPIFAACPINIMQTTQATSLTVVWSPPMITDNCTANPTLTSTHTPNTAFPIGTTTVVYTARDARNNSSNCSFTISVFPPNLNYCAAKAAQPYQEWISGVRFGTINNTLQAHEGKSVNWSVIGYSDFTNLTATVNRGQSYPLSITPSTSWSGRSTDLYCRVWIDFNGNKTFDDDELVLSGRSQNPFTGSIVLPTTTTMGNTRMRVSLKWGGLPTACENFTSGEVEDYTITIR